jgi:hypothetical protein
MVFLLVIRPLTYGLALTLAVADQLWILRQNEHEQCHDQYSDQEIEQLEFM